MEDILKAVWEMIFQELLLTPGAREKKRLMEWAKSGTNFGCDRVVSVLYPLSYGILLLGSIWGGMLLMGVAEPTLMSYGLCCLCGTLVLEFLLWLYTRVVKRSGWQVLIPIAIKRDKQGRVSGYYSLRWRWLLRAWGGVFLLCGLL